MKVSRLCGTRRARPRSQRRTRALRSARLAQGDALRLRSTRRVREDVRQIVEHGAVGIRGPDGFATTTRPGKQTVVPLEEQHASAATSEKDVGQRARGDVLQGQRTSAGRSAAKDQSERKIQVQFDAADRVLVEQSVVIVVFSLEHAEVSRKVARARRCEKARIGCARPRSGRILDQHVEGHSVAIEIVGAVFVDAAVPVVVDGQGIATVARLAGQGRRERIG